MYSTICIQYGPLRPSSITGAPPNYYDHPIRLRLPHGCVCCALLYFDRQHRNDHKLLKLFLIKKVNNNTTVALEKENVLNLHDVALSRVWF